MAGKWLCVVVYGFGRDVEEKNPVFWREVNIRRAVTTSKAVLCTVLLEINTHSGYICIECFSSSYV